MKTFRKIGIALLVLISIPLIAALFVPKEYKAERSIIINKPGEVVFDYIRHVKNQDNYGVWQLSDPDMKKTYEGTDGTVGFKYSWESEKLGKGSQKITAITPGKRFDTELDFGFGDPAKSYFLTEDEGPDKTKVTWGITGESPYPFNLMGLFYDMGKDFQKGLDNLKVQLEN